MENCPDFRVDFDGSRRRKKGWKIKMKIGQKIGQIVDFKMALENHKKSARKSTKSETDF